MVFLSSELIPKAYADKGADEQVTTGTDRWKIELKKGGNMIENSGSSSNKQLFLAG
jgi:hypothetical protein